MGLFDFLFEESESEIQVRRSKKELEGKLREVYLIREDLSAETVVQEEVSHEEDHVNYYAKPWAPPEIETVIDKEEVTKLNLEKINAAKLKLEQIYKTSEWFSVRYLAAVSLGHSADEIEREMVSWIKGIEKKVNWPSERQVTSSRGYGSAGEGGYAAWGETVEDEMAPGYWREGRIDAKKLYELSGSDKIKEWMR